MDDMQHSDSRALATRADLQELRDLTKADLDAHRQEVRVDLETHRREVRVDLETHRLEVKVDLDGLRQGITASVERLDKKIDTVAIELSKRLDKTATKDDIAAIDGKLDKMIGDFDHIFGKLKDNDRSVTVFDAIQKEQRTRLEECERRISSLEGRA